MKKVKLYFPMDAIFRDKVVYEKGSTHEVETENGWADRWIKRGAKAADELPKETVKTEVEEVQVVEEKPKSSKKSKQ